MANNRYIKQAVTTVDFAAVVGQIQPRHYVFEMDDRVDLEQYANGAVRVRRYPSEAPTITGSFGATTLWDSLIYNTIKGSVIFTQEVREREVFGTLEFTGGDRVRLPYPKGTMPSSRLQSSGVGGAAVNLYAGEITVNKLGQFYNLYGTPINVSLFIDDNTSEVIASQPCYGEIEYKYTTDYRILRYMPRSFKDLYGALMWGADDYGSIIAQYRVGITVTQNGRVVATPPPPILFKVSPPDNHNVEWELYRIESAVIVNEDGTWERPMAWPVNGDFEDTTQSLDPNTPSLEVKRVHEIAMFSLQEREKFDRLNSSRYFDVPLQYGPQARRLEANSIETQVDSTRSAVSFSTPPQEYTDRIKNFRTPKMRVSWYEQALQKPYEKYKWARTTAEHTAFLEKQQYAAARPSDSAAQAAVTNYQWPKAERRVVSAAIDANTGQVKYNTLSKTFKVKLNITAGRPPAGGTGTLNFEDRNSVDAQLQEQLLNREVSRAWQAIDWLAIRKSILARYPTSQFQLTFDSTFPGTDKTDLSWPPPARGYV